MTFSIKTVTGHLELNSEKVLFTFSYAIYLNYFDLINFSAMQVKRRLFIAKYRKLPKVGVRT